MACVTLKRPLDFDPLEVLHSPNRPATKRRRCTPIKNVDRARVSSRRLKAAAAVAGMSNSPIDSVFSETPLTQEDISSNLRDELKRLKRRRQHASTTVAAAVNNDPAVTPESSISSIIPHELPKSSFDASRENHLQGLQSIGERSMFTESATKDGSSNSSVSSSFPVEISSQMTPISTMRGNVWLSKDNAQSHSLNSIETNLSMLSMKETEKKVFTLKEMTLICEKMCKERTDAVRQEYDKILHQKLSEQYDAFVKFIDHQIQQRFNESQLPSYLS